VAVGALLGEAAAKSMPDGVLTLAPISGSDAGALLDDERIAAATFTGSTQVGLDVVTRLARRAAPAQAEMGGQNPAIVLDDADVDAAAARIV
ncbi:aldehyde dehydrogenase family protein, partial [Pseudomonas sp. 5B4]